MDFFSNKDDQKDRLYVATEILGQLIGSDTMAPRLDNLNTNLPAIALAYADLLLKAIDPLNPKNK